LEKDENEDDDDEVDEKDVEKLNSLMTSVSTCIYYLTISNPIPVTVLCLLET